MTWYTYKSPQSEQIFVMCRIDEDTVVSGVAEQTPEYLAWVAEGNTAEEWQPESEGN
jgi:hypothetical protein